jgi:hypothetical protein
VNPILPAKERNQMMAKNVNGQQIEVGSLSNGRVVNEAKERHFVRQQLLLI